MANTDLTEKQKQFKRYYLMENSRSYGDVVASALRAGFSIKYAEKIHSVEPNWLKSLVRDYKIKENVQNNLEEFTSADYGRDDHRREKIKADMTKFIAQTTMPEKYGNITRLANADGSNLSLSRLFGLAESDEAEAIDAEFEIIDDEGLGMIDAETDEDLANLSE